MEEPIIKEFTDESARACTAACTDDGESTPGNANGGFAEALAMIARLPLSDSEKADAVRRLLAGGQLP